MNIYLYSLILSIITTIAVGVGVISINPHRALYRIWFFLNIIVALWACGWVIMFMTDSFDVAYLSSRFSASIVCFVPALFVHFILELIESVKTHRRLLIVSYLICSINSLIGLTPFLVLPPMTKSGFNFYTTAGPAYLSYILSYFSLPTIACILAYQYSLKSSVQKRIQLKYVLTASIVGFGSAASAFPLTYSYHFPPYLLNLLFIYPLVIACAIVRHRLMEIEVIAKRGLIYSILIASVSAIYFGGVYALGSLFAYRLPFAANVTGLFLVIIFSLAVQPFLSGIRNMVERAFFRAHYDHRQILRELSENIVRIIRLDDLIIESIQTITQGLNVKNVCILYPKPGQNSFDIRFSEENAEALCSHENVMAIINAAQKHKTVLLRDVFVERTQSIDPDSNPTCAMESIGILIAIPLFSKEQLMGSLCLGEKKSGGQFTIDDISLLTMLANQLAIAIENAVLHEEIMLTTRQLYEVDKLATLGSIAASLAHEVKNPLMIIKGFIESMDSENDGDLKLTEDFKQVVPAQITRMQNLLNGMFRLGKPTNGDRKLIQLNTILNETLIFFENKCHKKKIIINNELGDIPEIMANPEEMVQLATNLILNAIQAMEDIGGTLTVRTSSSNASHGKPCTAIEIADTGPGMPTEIARKIFDPFFTTKENGTGLGLAVCKRIIDDHRGIITVESKRGEGTTFKVQF